MMLRSMFPKGGSSGLAIAVAVCAPLVVASPAAASKAASEGGTVASRSLAVGGKQPARTMRAARLHSRQAKLPDAWNGRQFVLMLGIGY